MKIVLVNPPPRNELDRHWAPFPVLGLAYVAASLRARGHRVVLLDGKLAGLSLAAIHTAIVAERADLIGITCMTFEFPATCQIVSRLRESGSTTPIVLGGAHVSAVGIQALEECPGANFACIGEGEHLVCELIEVLSGERTIDQVAGLAYRAGSAVRRNQAREYHDDYDALSFPAWELFQVGSQIPILTHRGCPFQCNFCGHNSGFKPRYRSTENVLEELGQTVERFKPQTIRFEDETFGLNAHRTKQILNGILARKLHERVNFSAQTRVDRIDLEFVRLLKACNFETLELGVESGNPEVLSRMGKGISIEQVEHAVALARREGLRVWCKFILGHPHETPATLRDTANFIARLNPDRLSVSIMTPFPGTPVFDMAVRGEGGYRMLSHDWVNFDKYASGALELEHASLATLKFYQVACYLLLYVKNRRTAELARLAFAHRSAANALIVSLAHSLLHRASPAQPASRSNQADLHVSARSLSDVAMPDSTLLRLRTRNKTGSTATVAPPSELSALRSWASPGEVALLQAPAQSTSSGL